MGSDGPRRRPQGEGRPVTWSYRVIRDDDGGHRIAEIYTDLPHVPGRIAWSADPRYPWGDTLDELRTDLERMRLALLQPVLPESELRAAIEKVSPE